MKEHVFAVAGDETKPFVVHQLLNDTLRHDAIPHLRSAQP
jgi:hypothetical protein